MSFQINYNLIKAIARRDLKLYFANPTGYVFVTLFIFMSATAAFWQERFFLNNLANLDQLNAFFPLLLIFFIPALTMGIWSDEKKQGTDELLLTLPGTDLEIVAGKYVAAVGIYTASLLLSLSHVIVLMVLGSPDLGLMFGNYLGFWFLGSAFIAVGMLASLLTRNATVAFIFGSLMCGILVFMEPISLVFGEFIGGRLETLSVTVFFLDFARGMVSFRAFLYFESVALLMLYLNILLIGRRHWPREADGLPMWQHQTVRTIAIIIAVVSLNVIIGRASFRLDVTAEQLHSLSGETERLIDTIPDERPVLIQAFISKDVPKMYVQTRENLVSYLEEMDAIGGDKISVMFHETEMYSEEARDAREKFGILPRDLVDQGSARANVLKVFMGVAFTSGAEEEVIPFFDRGLPTEYELLRSIRTVTKTEKKKIGVLTTEVKLFGGFDFQTMKSTPAWQVIDEINKQYEAVRISADAPITEPLDGLIVALPSSLPQPQLDNLLAVIESGTPTLLLIDPMPIWDLTLAPLEEPGGQQNPFMQQQQAPKEPKGDIAAFMRRLGIFWNTEIVNWDSYNPHPEMANMPPEVVFLGAANDKASSFNEENIASSGLQEIVFLYPGSINPTNGSNLTFQPLLKTSKVSGVLGYSNLVQRSFFGTQINQGLRHYPQDKEYNIAAQVSGSLAPDGESADTQNINVIAIADLDFISSQFFEIRKAGIANLNFDNVTFVLNCMDVLIGDDSFIDLRKRRVRHRTLETVEQQTQGHVEERVSQEQAAEREAQAALGQAQQSLNAKVAEVQQRQDLDQQTKQIMVRNLQEVENRKFEALRARITAEKEAKISRGKEDMEAEIRAIQNTIKMLAVMLPPIPVLIMGIMIFLRRRKSEQEGAVAARRLRQ